MSGRKCLLIVDDEEEVTNMFARFLEKRGYAVKTAPNALEAIRICHKGGIDLILTDYQMPEVTGIELLKEIRQTWPETPVILMSGRADMRTALDALREHAFDFLSKPIDSKDLVETINKALEHASPEANLPAGHIVPLVGPVGHARAQGFPDTSILEINRPLDGNSDKNFGPMIRRYLTDGEIQQHVIVNFKNVTYINNLGLNYLIDLFGQLKGAGFKVAFTGFQDSVHRYLKTLGYLEFFPYMSSLEKALLDVRQ